MRVSLISVHSSRPPKAQPDCRPAAVKRHLERTLSSSDASGKFEEYTSRVANANLTNREARLVARDIAGEDIKWDWDLPRTKEGYYHYKSGVAVRTDAACSASSFD